VASVVLDFVPPSEPDIAALRVFEAPSSAGPFAQILRTTAVGTYPNYLTRLAVTAASVTNWFSIQWEDVNGVLSPQSAPIQGGTDTLVGRVVARVLQRDSTLSEPVVTQEAEAAIATYLNIDPYDPDVTVTYAQLNGLTYLVMGRTMISRQLQQAASGSVDDATIGLVSMKSGTTSTSQTSQSKDAVKDILELAMQELGVPRSVILHLAEPTTIGSFSSYDHSRLIGWVGLV
jgi:hypothetical protein